ncbi:MAG: hypothetical protein AAF560_29210 [Acidobacteriota bacterium]
MRAPARIVRRWSRAWLGALLATAVCGAWAEQPPATFELEDEAGPISQLEIGRSLFVRSGELTQPHYVVVLLIDEDEIDRIASTAIDPAAGHQRLLLWGATGIVGCDCGSEAGPYAFARFEHAVEALAGRVVRVELQDAAGEVIAAKSVPLVEPQRPIAHTADASGCPRFRFADGEELYLFVRGGRPGEEVSTRLVLGGTESAEDVPLQDVRGEAWEAETYTLTPPETRILLWHIKLGFRGDLVPSTTSSDWPFEVVFFEKHLNSGVVVQDHSCPPPPPPPP